MAGDGDQLRPLSLRASMTSMQLIKELVSPNGKRKVRLYRRDDQLFSFDEIYEDFDEYAGAYWIPEYQSGVFADMALAEAEMHAVTSWLKVTSQ